MIGSVKRAIDLLYCFTKENSELSVSELSLLLGVHKSTISRLLSTLAPERLVSINPDNGKYRLGMGLIELSGYVVLHSNLREIAIPYLKELCEKTKETVNLAVLEQDAAINIEQVVPHDRRLISFGWVGRRTPLHASSTGKVLLAFLPEERYNQVLKVPLQKYTHKTITEPKKLLRELSNIQKLGYAYGLEELEIGLNAVAGPIFNHNQEVIAAVSVTGPPSRLTRKKIDIEITDLVQNYALNISYALGYPFHAKQ
jgi:IclR family transcriptional regulator, acetate operon repressor